MWAYRSNENILSPIPGYDWLIFCYEKFDTSSKKEMKMITKKFLMKNNQNTLKKYTQT